MELVSKDTVKYKVVEFLEEQGQILVIYENLNYPVSIDLYPKEDGLYPVGEELDQIIRNMAPITLINRQIAISNGVANASEIQQMVIPVEKEETPANALDLFEVLK